MTIGTVGGGQQFNDGNPNEVIFFAQLTPVALIGAAQTLTAQSMTQGLITVAPGTAAATTLVLDTGVNLDKLFSNMRVDTAFDVVISNISAVATEIVTLTPSAGVTIVGNATLNPNTSTTIPSSAIVRFRKTGVATYVAYRLS